MTDFMKLARRRGFVPDWVWYQINGQSATENWIDYAREIIWYGRRNGRMMFSSQPNKIEEI